MRHLQRAGPYELHRLREVDLMAGYYRQAETWAELCARLPESTRAYAEAAEAAAPPLPPDQIAALKPIFAAAGERILAARPAARTAA